jgi:hypothetical protein
MALARSNDKSMDPTLERLSMDWIRRAAEYRNLTGKRDLLGYALDAPEAERLAALELFFHECGEDDRPAFEVREQIRASISLLVTYAAPDGTGVGEARDVSGDGMFIDTRAPLPIGAHTVVRVIDRIGGDEWRFSAEVIRLTPGPNAGMGVRFLGIPLQLRLGHRQPHKTLLQPAA